MTLLEVINAVLALGLELWMLWAYGALGWHLGHDVWTRWVWMSGAVLLVVALWAVWGAPKSANRLRAPGLYVFKGCLFAGASASLFLIAQPIRGGVFLVLSSVHLALAAQHRDP